MTGQPDLRRVDAGQPQEFDPGQQPQAGVGIYGGWSAGQEPRFLVNARVSLGGERRRGGARGNRGCEATQAVTGRPYRRRLAGW